MTALALPAPYWEGAGVKLYFGQAEEIGPRLVDRGMVFMDPPYSAHVHAKSRAGARKTPLVDGNGNMSHASISRTKTFGFEHLTPELQRDLARISFRLARRWVLVFCDLEGISGWKNALEEAGLNYRRTMLWDKIGSTPQFTGDQPAVAGEAIVAAHPFCGNGRERRRWNSHGKRGIYSVPIELNRGGGGEKRINETQKPLLLIEAILRDFAEPDELVYDFVAGGGTTGVACIHLGLRGVLIERRKEQIEATADRLEAEARKPKQTDFLTARVPEMKQVDLFAGGML